MTVRNSEIKAVSPIIINAVNEQIAKETAEKFERIVRENSGVRMAELFKDNDTTYVIQFGFTNLDMYKKYLIEAQKSGLL